MIHFLPWVHFLLVPLFFPQDPAVLGLLGYQGVPEYHCRLATLSLLVCPKNRNKNKICRKYFIWKKKLWINSTIGSIITEGPGGPFGPAGPSFPISP